MKKHIRARGFWQSGQLAFFDVRVFNPTAKRYTKQDLSKSYESNEKEKKIRYNNRILEVEHGSFTPLVFSATGGMGREAKKFYSRLAEIIAEKRQAKQHIITTWIRRKINFSLIRSIGTRVYVAVVLHLAIIWKIQCQTMHKLVNM